MRYWYQGGCVLLDCQELENPREKLNQDLENLAKEDAGIWSWLKEYGRSGKDKKVGLLLGLEYEGVSTAARGKLDKCVMGEKELDQMLVLIVYVFCILCILCYVCMVMFPCWTQQLHYIISGTAGRSRKFLTCLKSGITENQTCLKSGITS